MAQVSSVKANKRVEKKPRNRQVSIPGIMTQICHAFRRENLLATLAGMIGGGFVPIATYFVCHHEVMYSWHGGAMFALVLGGLLFSAKTVWQWAYQAFAKDAWKATGFVVLLEGVMTLSQIQVLAVAALVLLTAINGIATGVVLSKS